MFCKKDVLRKLRKNHRIFFLYKVAGLLWRRYFPVNFAKLLRTLFSVDISGGHFFPMLPNLKRRRTEHIQFKNKWETKQNTNWKVL